MLGNGFVCLLIGNDMFVVLGNAKIQLFLNMAKYFCFWRNNYNRKNTIFNRLTYYW